MTSSSSTHPCLWTRPAPAAITGGSSPWTALVRMSSVVLTELLRGVTGPAEHKFLRNLARNHPILTPTQKNWLESGEILAKIRADQGFEPHKLRDLHVDVLIALTARSHGARLVTTNRKDFELISRYRQIKLEVW